MSEIDILVEIAGREDQSGSPHARRFRLDLTVPEDESETQAVRRVVESVEDAAQEAIRFYRG